MGTRKILLTERTGKTEWLTKGNETGYKEGRGRVKGQTKGRKLHKEENFT